MEDCDTCSEAACSVAKRRMRALGHLALKLQYSIRTMVKNRGDSCKGVVAMRGEAVLSRFKNTCSHFQHR